MRDTVAIVLGSAGLVFFAGCFFLDRYRTKRELSRWTHTGLPPPPGFAAAAALLRELTGIAGGSIRWVAGAISLPDGGSAAGLTLVRGAHQLKLQWFERMEETAFAHEGWVLWHGRDYHDPEQLRWVRLFNAEVARRLGRA